MGLEWEAALPAVGAEAPDFRLPAVSGEPIALSDHRGCRSVVVWFSLGLFCPFCRRSMTQLRQAYPRMREVGAELLQISHNTLDEARAYLKHYPFAFPYLCDPDRAVHERYGVPLVPATLGGKLRGMGAATADLVLRGERSPLPLPMMKRFPGKDSTQALVIVDRTGLVRAVHRGDAVGGLPGASDLIRALQAL